MVFPTVTITVPLRNAGIGVTPEAGTLASPAGPTHGTDRADRSERPDALGLRLVPGSQAPERRPERRLEFATPGTAYGFSTAFATPRESGIQAPWR